MAKIWERERSVPFIPETGKVYRNAGGGEFLCTGEGWRWNDETGWRWDGYWMTNIVSSWTCVAHGVRQYSDGSIEWDYSTDGHFDEEMQKRIASGIRHRQLSLANALLGILL